MKDLKLFDKTIRDAGPSYVVLDKHNNFYAKTYSLVDAKKFAATDELLKFAKDMADCGGFTGSAAKDIIKTIGNI